MDDASQIQMLFPKWEIVRFLTAVVPWPYPDDGARRWCETALAAVERGDEWCWTLRLKSNADQIVGVIHLMKKNENRGFWLGVPWQGQGLMTEAVETVTDFWFNVLKFPTLRVSKAVTNIPSRRISEKMGMRLVGTEERDYVSGRLLAEIWEMTADEWNARRRLE